MCYKAKYIRPLSKICVVLEAPPIAVGSGGVIHKDSYNGEWLATQLLNRDESFEAEEGKNVVTVEQKIKQLYDAVFVTEYTGNVHHTILGESEFDGNSKAFIMRIESMLSAYADYDK